MRNRNCLTQTTLIILSLILILNVSNQTYQTKGCVEHTQNKDQYNSNGDFTVISHNTQIDVVSVDTIEAREIFKIENKNPLSVDFISLWLNHSCKNIVVEDPIGTLEYEKLVDSLSYCNLKINFRTNLSYKEQMIFYITYSLNDFPLAESLNHYYFEFYSTITFTTKLHHLSIILPERCYVSDDTDVTTIYPVNQTQSFMGRRLILSWTQSNLTFSVNPFYLVRFDSPRNLTWLYIVSPILGVGIGVASTVWFMRRRERSAIQSMGTVFLNESQRVLLKTILENDGKIAQKDLCRKTGFTRSKTSRNLISLEEQGFIVKEKWGRNSLIKLTKSGEMVIE